jgi:hypothetical protein
MPRDRRAAADGGHGVRAERVAHADDRDPVAGSVEPALQQRLALVLAGLRRLASLKMTAALAPAASALFAFTSNVRVPRWMSATAPAGKPAKSAASQPESTCSRRDRSFGGVRPVAASGGRPTRTAPGGESSYRAFRPPRTGTHTTQSVRRRGPAAWSVP